MIIRATMMATAGSIHDRFTPGQTSPAIQITSSPNMTPNEVYTSVRRCQPSACSATDSVSRPTLKSRRDTRVFTIADTSITPTPQTGISIVLRIQQLPHGGVDDPDRRDEDEDGLYGARDVLELAVAVGMALVGGLARLPHGEERDQGGHQVDGGVDGFGYDRHRPYEESHDYLEQDEERVGGDRQYGHPCLAPTRVRQGGRHYRRRHRREGRGDGRPFLLVPTDFDHKRLQTHESSTGQSASRRACASAARSSKPGYTTALDASGQGRAACSARV